MADAAHSTVSGNLSWWLETSKQSCRNGLNIWNPKPEPVRSVWKFACIHIEISLHQSLISLVTLDLRGFKTTLTLTCIHLEMIPLLNQEHTGYIHALWREEIRKKKDIWTNFKINLVTGKTQHIKRELDKEFHLIFNKKRICKNI